MREKSEDFQVFESISGNNLLLLPDAPVFTIVAVSNDFLATSGIQRKAMVNKGLVEVVSNNPSDVSASNLAELGSSLQSVIHSKQPHTTGSLCFNVAAEGRLANVVWSHHNSPVFNKEGELSYIVNTWTDVTDKVISQQIAGTSRQNFEHFFYQSNVPFAILKGKDFVFTFANPAYLQLLNGRPLLGKALLEALPELENQPFLNLLQEVFTDGVAKELPEIAATAMFSSNNQPSTRYFNLSYAPYRNEAGEIEGIFAMGYDVTEQVELRKREIKSRLYVQAYNLFMQTPVAICILKGSDFVIELANEPMLQLWGKRSEIIGKPVLEALPEIKGQGFIELLNQVTTTGEPFYANENVAKLIRNGREETVYLNFSYQPYYEEDGTISGVIAIANEVTEQVIARLKAEESEKRFRNLVEDAPVATCVFAGKNMVIQLANETILQAWGKDASVIGKALLDALPELEGQPFYSLLQNVYKTGETYRATEDKADLVVNGTLQRFYFNFTYKALRNADGQIYGVLNMAVDVTENVVARKKLQESEERLENRVAARTKDLMELNDQLERSNVELEQFTYAASHDMQEPLRKVQVFTNFLLQRNAEQLNESGKGYLSKIEKSVSRMKTIIDDLLQYSRHTHHDQPFQLTDLNEIIEDIQADLELTIEQKNATVIKEKLPVTKVIPGQINQLFYNLITNALKFGKPDTPINIVIRARELTQQEVSNIRQLKSITNMFKSVSTTTVSDSSRNMPSRFFIYLNGCTAEVNMRERVSDLRSV
jgi:PAS domain S-box-containing protein